MAIAKPVTRIPNMKPVLKNAVPKDYAPSKIWHKVQDKENWGSVAAKFGVNTQKLIYFNFKTNIPEEVNWYLQRNVGCNVSLDGLNWAFSSSANPGKIYIPGRTVSLEAEVIDPGRRNKLAVILDDHEEEFEVGKGTETVLFVLDIYEVAHTVLEVANVAALIGGSEALEGLSTDAGLLLPIAFGIKFWTELGKANYEPYLNERRQEFLRGLSEGIVTGANDAKPSYLSTLRYWKQKGERIPNRWYPEKGGELAQYHNLGVKTGYKYGKQLNLAEQGALFTDLHSRMSPPYKEKYPSGPWSGWSEDMKKKYYDDCALLFRIAHLPR